jgi:hypothetical protein
MGVLVPPSLPFLMVACWFGLVGRRLEPALEETSLSSSLPELEAVARKVEMFGAGCEAEPRGGDLQRGKELSG